MNDETIKMPTFWSTAWDLIFRNYFTIGGWMGIAGSFLMISIAQFVPTPAAAAMTGLTGLFVAIFMLPLGYTLPKINYFE